MPYLTSAATVIASTDAGLGFGIRARTARLRRGVAGRRWRSGPPICPPGRFCHFVHSVPRGPLEEALRIARRQGASTIYVTDRTDRCERADPWETMPATGTKSSRWSERVSRNEEGRGSVTGRTTVVIDRPTESPCRCHPWSSQLLSSP